MPTTQQPLLIADHLHVKNRLNGISFELKQGEILGLMGENGAGKSTLLSALNAFIPFSGNLLLSQQNLFHIPPVERAQKMAMIFQTPFVAWNLSVWQTVALGRLPWQDQNQEAIQNALKINGLEHLSLRKIAQLSGGERARVLIARAFAGNPQILLADEPFAHLDAFYQKKLVEIFQQFAQSGKSIIVALHNLRLAEKLCQRILLLKNGHFIAQGQPSLVFNDSNLKKAFNLNKNEFI